MINLRLVPFEAMLNVRLPWKLGLIRDVPKEEYSVTLGPG
jgi:hypothetical protein